jgi:DNA-3-methyladenine glycosylase
MRSAPITRAFYGRPTAEVARDLLGTILRHGAAAARIVEVEAYLGENDAAAHSARGPTPRTQIIFGPPGHAYVYLIYGMHFCLNIVAEAEGKAGCVLIRAVEPIEGVSLPTNGPGKLTRALGITLEQYGTDLTRGALTVCAPERRTTFEIGVSPRIGITKAIDLPLRFFIRGNRYVSGLTTRAAAHDQNFARNIIR